MKRSALIGLLLVFAAAPLSAQSTWESRTRTGEYAFAVGDTDRALAEFQAALEIAQRFPPPDRRLETSLGNLARRTNQRVLAFVVGVAVDASGSAR